MRGWKQSLPTDSAERLIVVFAFVILVASSLALVTKAGVTSYRHATRVGVVLTDGQLNRREAGRMKWSATDVETPVYLHDTLRTYQQPAVVLLENGREIRIPAGTMIRLDEMNEEVLSVTVLSGTMPSSEMVVAHRERGPSSVPARANLSTMMAAPVAVPAMGSKLLGSPKNVQP